MRAEGVPKPSRKEEGSMEVSEEAFGEETLFVLFLLLLLYLLNVFSIRWIFVRASKVEPFFKAIIVS